MEVLRKLQDGVDPVAEAPHALGSMKNSSAAEDELLRSGTGPSTQHTSLLLQRRPSNDPCVFYRTTHSPIRETQDEELDERRLEKELLIF